MRKLIKLTDEIIEAADRARDLGASSSVGTMCYVARGIKAAVRDDVSVFVGVHNYEVGEYRGPLTPSAKAAVDAHDFRQPVKQRRFYLDIPKEYLP